MDKQEVDVLVDLSGTKVVDEPEFNDVLDSTIEAFKTVVKEGKDVVEASKVFSEALVETFQFGMRFMNELRKSYDGVRDVSVSEYDDFVKKVRVNADGIL